MERSVEGSPSKLFDPKNMVGMGRGSTECQLFSEKNKKPKTADFKEATRDKGGKFGVQQEKSSESKEEKLKKLR